ncbi:hypothetical protein [Salmonella enterica]|uniref:hypothetical protein n=1 Tax=Salmonella enterica TaxID=28901 RepID=UPI0002B60E77|nr:hypothetical protein [Salmonella enterica]CCS30241.1 Putative bacteriophage protein [Salmonella enterica subsp. enterica serovar Agona str. 40.E.08]
MAKPDWGALQHQFLAEHAKSGISPKDWCEAQGLNYASAKRYIKVTNYRANSQKSSAKKSANSQKVKKATSKPALASREKSETSKSASSSETKPIRGSRTSPPVNPFAPGNQHALKHGGYGRRLLLSDATSEDAQALSLDDELFWLRAANLTAAENIGRWRTMMDDAADEDEKQQFLDNISAAEKAMHRNTARIESLELTKASIEHRLASAEKVTLEADRLKREAGDPNNNAPRGLNDFYADIETDTESGAASVLDDESQE